MDFGVGGRAQAEGETLREVESTMASELKKSWDSPEAPTAVWRAEQSRAEQRRALPLPGLAVSRVMLVNAAAASQLPVLWLSSSVPFFFSSADGDGTGQDGAGNTVGDQMEIGCKRLRRWT